MNCHICNSDQITHYKQKRRDGVWVVTARCANDHIPEKGKPFYSISLFDIASLPVLGEDNPSPQLDLFPKPEKKSRPVVTEQPAVDMIAERRKIYENFKRNFSHD